MGAELGEGGIYRVSGEETGSWGAHWARLGPRHLGLRARRSGGSNPEL